MGTSGCYPGPLGKNPLIPSWLDPEPEENHTPTPAINPAGIPNNDPVTNEPLPQTQVPNNDQQNNDKRFQSARRGFSQYAKSGGENDRALRRALSNYVSKGAGGASSATKRLGASRTAGAKLYSFLSSVQASGLNETLRSINLENLAGRSINEIFVGLCDYICPDGGRIDEGITRHAFTEAIAQVTSEGITSFDSLSIVEMETILQVFFTNSIEARVFNDIATKGIVLPEDIDVLESIQDNLRDFIRTAVIDAMATNRVGDTITNSASYIDLVYEAAFSFLEALGSEEG